MKHTHAEEDKKAIPTLSEVDEHETPGYLIPRLEKDGGYSKEQATLLVREAKRMLYLCIVSGESIAPSGHVDDAWHAMLMFTRYYRDFANFIGGFVHHDPTPPEFWKEKEASGEVDLKGGTPTYKRTKENYERLFGETPDPWAWP